MAGHLVRRSPVPELPGTAAEQPVDQPVAEGGHRAPLASRRRAAVTARAAAAATMPATLWVPLRRSRSWPPPRVTGSSGTPSRTTSTPTPFGPPNLWALRSTRSAGGR